MKNLAIIIGVSQYADENNNLPACLNDVKIIESLFNSIIKYDDVLIEKGNIESNKVRDSITTFIQKYQNEIIGEVFFYYTGHGCFDGTNFYYNLSNYDKRNKRQTSIENSEIDTWLRSLKAKLTIKVIDACYSAIKHIKDDFFQQYFNDTKTGFNECYFMYSSLSYQKSYQNELLSDFTLSFINSLFKKDKIKYRDIMNSISDEFEHNNKQTPFFVVQADYTEDFADIDESIKAKLKEEMAKLPKYSNKMSFGSKSEEKYNQNHSCLITPENQEPEKRIEILDDKSEYAEHVKRYFNRKFEDALETFPSQPKVWVEPILSKNSEVSKDADSENIIDLSELISNPKSIIIKALPQFGLTCLSHYLIKEAWHTQELWQYLDSKNLKPYPNEIKKAVNKDMDILGCEIHDIKCVILDSCSILDKNFLKLLREVCTFFKNIPVIVMQTVDDSRILAHSGEDELDRKFDTLYLWALPRGHVRQVVSKYNEERHIGDEDSVITKVVTDLEVLNLHRTPLNCLTLLKVSEIDFDESPVNRTEL